MATPDDGFQLGTIVLMPRGMTEAEAYNYLATGDLPPFGDPVVTSTPPTPEPTGMSPGEAWDFLTGQQALTASDDHWKHELRDADGQWTDTPGSGLGKEISKALKKITPTKAIYRATIPDGEVVAQRGDERMRWDAGAKKFHHEKREGAGWKSQKTLNKKQAYEQVKSGDWHEAEGGAPKTEVQPRAGTFIGNVPETHQNAKPHVEPTPKVDTSNDPNFTTYTGPKWEPPPGVTEQDIFDWYKLDEIPYSERTPEQHKQFNELQQKVWHTPGGDDYRRRVFEDMSFQRALEEDFIPNNEEQLKGMSDKEIKASFVDKLHSAFNGKKIGVRVTPGELGKILGDGRFKTQFETNKSKGLKDPMVRAHYEARTFGLKVNHPVEKRPIYGYVMLDGPRPAGSGSKEALTLNSDALSQYGMVQVVLKDSVRPRTTAMMGDSLNANAWGRPTPVNDPEWVSFTPGNKSVMSGPLAQYDRNVESADFRSKQYAEAQIHDGVSTDDIEEVIFPSNPPTALQKQLSDAGVKWRVLNYKTAADSPPDEKANVLKVAEQDKVLLESHIADLEAKIPTYAAKGDNYTVNQLTKEVAPLKKQLKAIDDALPGLRGESKTAKAKPVKSVTPTPTPEAPSQSPSTQKSLSAEDAKRLTEIADEFKSMQHDTEVSSNVVKDIAQKVGQGGIYTEAIRLHDEFHQKKLKELDARAQKLNDEKMAILIKRDGEPWGSVPDFKESDPAFDHKPVAPLKPGVDQAKFQKTRDSYVANDKQTITKNSDLRSGNPAPASIAWRNRMSSMVRSGEMSSDATVYRGAAFQPDTLIGLRPGAVLHDLGVMSTDEDYSTAKFYADVRQRRLPGSKIATFEIRVPKGTPVADVDIGEFVFDANTSLRILSSKLNDDGTVDVVAEMIPPVKKGKKNG